MTALLFISQNSFSSSKSLIAFSNNEEKTQKSDRLFQSCHPQNINSTAGREENRFSRMRAVVTHPPGFVLLEPPDSILRLISRAPLCITEFAPRRRAIPEKKNTQIENRSPPRVFTSPAHVIKARLSTSSHNARAIRPTRNTYSRSNRRAREKITKKGSEQRKAWTKERN